MKSFTCVKEILLEKVLNVLEDGKFIHSNLMENMENLLKNTLVNFKDTLDGHYGQLYKECLKAILSYLINTEMNSISKM